MSSTPAETRFKVHGLDCAEEVAVLKREVGPLVGGADRLTSDVLNGRMTVAAPPEAVSQEDVFANPSRRAGRAVDTPLDPCPYLLSRPGPATPPRRGRTVGPGRSPTHGRLGGCPGRSPHAGAAGTGQPARR